MRHRRRFVTPLLSLLALPLLVACSDQRATFEIKGSAHAISLIRVTGMPWENKAKYTVVAARMPDCMRRHALPDAGLKAKVEVFSPGNEAWILRQEGRLFVIETRTCEGFAKLDKMPDSGIGTPMGVFEMRKDTLVFTPAVNAAASAGAPAEPGIPAPESIEN